MKTNRKVILTGRCFNCGHARIIHHKNNERKYCARCKSDNVDKQVYTAKNKHGKEILKYI